VEVIEGKGVQVPIYRSDAFGKESYLLAYYAEGKRVRERAGSLEAARKVAKAKINELTTGAAHVGNFTPRETAVVTEAVEIARRCNVSLMDALRQHEEALRILAGRGTLLEAAKHFADFVDEEKARGALARISVPNLVRDFLKHLEVREMSRRYIGDMRARLGRASKAFRGDVNDIKTDQIDAWLASFRNASGQTRNNYRTAICTLFSYAKDKGFLPRDKPTEAEFSTRLNIKRGEIGIYQPETIEILLSRIERRLLPFVAFGAFAGLRSAEITRLEWSDVRWDQNLIMISSGKAKTASRRLIPILPALVAWLAPWRGAKGKVLEGVSDEFALAKNFKKAVNAIVDQDGRPSVEIVRNGLRHSYVSYRLAATQNAAQVALEAGNSPKMIFQHYRELVTPEDAEKWFSIEPKKP